MIDVSVRRFLLLAVTGWVDRREREALAYLIEENRFLRQQMGGGALSTVHVPADGWDRNGKVDMMKR